MAVPYTFGTATAAIPLSQLDSNFATAITIGNTAVQLGNTVTTLNNMTLANVTITSGTVTITNVAVTTANVSGTANISTLVVTANASVAGNVTVSGNTVVTGNVTSATHILTGGTANGVVYLDTTKALTTGSALTFDGTNLGIGVITPSRLLDTQKDANAATQLRIRNDNNGTSSQTSVSASYGDFSQYVSMAQYSPSFTTSGLRVASSAGVFTNGNSNGLRIYTIDAYPVIFGVNDTEQMRLTSTGLGIGTSSPAQKFVVSNGGAAGVEVSPTGGSQGGTYLQSYNRSGAAFVATELIASKIGFYTGTSPTLSALLDSSGNLLVGATSGSGKLYVESTSSVHIVARNPAGSSYTSLRLYNDQNSNIRALEIDYFGSTASGGERAEITTTGAYPLCFLTGNTERARIDSSGNLLVGTTSAISTERLNVTKAVNGGVGIAMLNNTNNTSGDQCLRLALGANTANTSSYLFVGATWNGGISFTDRIYIYGNGNVVNSNNSYGSLSDRKLKENVTDATPKLEKLNQVRVVNFNLIGEEQKQLGVIAQELEQIFPGMVDESPDKDAEGNDLGTTTKSVKYSVFVPMLIKAIQEQQAIIQSLTARITALEGA